MAQATSEQIERVEALMNEILKTLNKNRVVLHAATALLPFALAGRPPSDEQAMQQLEAVMSTDAVDLEALWPAIIEFATATLAHARRLKAAH